MRKHPGLTFGVLADELVVMLPIGLALTRVVNFINDELVGDVCRPDRPWCILFPSAPGYRYPSQLFESALDLAVLPIIYVVSKRKPPDGVTAWTWIALYGVTRTLGEIWRQTDLAVGPLTGGQLLSLPMIALGIGLAVWAARRGIRTDVAPRSAARAEESLAT